VLHSIVPELYGVETRGPVPELALMDLQNAREKLHRYVERIPDLRTVKHKEIAFLGSASEAIQSVGESNGIDLLVLGSHGRHGLAKLTLGSVAEWAIRRLTYPVLVAGPMCDKTPPGPLPGWYGVILSALCIVQFTASMVIDSRYEEQMGRQFFWIIWYPLTFWMIGMVTTVVAVPKVLAQGTRNRAVWESPDRPRSLHVISVTYLRLNKAYSLRWNRSSFRVRRKHAEAKDLRDRIFRCGFIVSLRGTGCCQRG
jgi:hypothetical protein